MRDPESPYVEVLKENLREGKLGNKEMTCGILKRRVDKGGDEGVILLDGEFLRFRSFEPIVGVDRRTDAR